LSAAQAAPSARGGGASPQATARLAKRSARGARVLRIDGNHRSTALVYRLAHGGRVVFRLRQISPSCGLVRKFTVRGHRGANRVDFTLRRFRRRLGRGTYRLVGRSRGRVVVRRTLVIGGGAAGNSCAAPAAGAGTTGPPSSAAGGGSSPSGKSRLASAGSAPKAAPSHSSGVLGTSVSKLVPGSGKTQIALLVVLSAAILLLAVGAVPREIVPHAAAAAFIARRRTLIAAGGLAALAAFLISYFVT
jgi:hypothetical protein